MALSIRWPFHLKSYATILLITVAFLNLHLANKRKLAICQPARDEIGPTNSCTSLVLVLIGIALTTFVTAHMHNTYTTPAVPPKVTHRPDEI